MVDILMATYNGAAFVEEQVRSIIQQTFTNWRLLIHDDGSIDATMDILHRLAEEDNRIVLIEDGMQHFGVARNFIHLVALSTDKLGRKIIKKIVRPAVNMVLPDIRQLLS